MAAENMKNSENIFLSLIEFAQNNADGLDKIWTIATGLVLALLFFLKPIYKAFFGEKKLSSDSNSTTVIVQNFDREYFRDLIKEEFGEIKSDVHKKSGNTPEIEDAQSSADILQAVEQLSNLRRTLKPAELNPELFPSDLDVLCFDPNGTFKIRSIMSKGGRIFIGLFCLPHYLIFIGGVIAAISGSIWLGGIISFALWVWRNRLGNYVSINFQKKKHALIMPAAASWFNKFPEVSLKSTYENNKWTTLFLIGEQIVVERASVDKKRHNDLEELAKALKWKFGEPIEVAEGVYISP